MKGMEINYNSIL